MNIETLQAAERVSAWYRNRRPSAGVAAYAVMQAANDTPLHDTPPDDTVQGCNSDASSVGVAALLRSAHSTPATSKATPAKVSA